MKKSKEEIIFIINSSKSKREVIFKLGLKPAGGNYQTLDKFIKTNNVDISHFSGKSWNKNIKIGPKKDLNLYLNNTYAIQSNKLKKRLLSEKIFESVCSSCLGKTWLDNPIPLELDHIDGNNQNNNLDNLRLLCPNCHSLTPTYRGRNIKR